MLGEAGAPVRARRRSANSSPHAPRSPSPAPSRRGSLRKPGARAAGKAGGERAAGSPDATPSPPRADPGCGAGAGAGAARGLQDPAPQAGEAVTTLNPKLSAAPAPPTPTTRQERFARLAPPGEDLGEGLNSKPGAAALTAPAAAAASAAATAAARAAGRPTAGPAAAHDGARQSCVPFEKLKGATPILLGRGLIMTL